jgi:hypothetical protein
MYVKQAIDNFWANVISDAKDNLKKKNASGALSNSLKAETIEYKNSFTTSLSMEDYGIYIDQGVKGVGGTKADGTKWKKKSVFGSRENFRYKNKRPPYMAFNGWSIRRGIAPRTKSGKFQKRKGLLFALANSVYHTGLETTHFLTTPFEYHFKSLPDDIVEAYALEVEDLLKMSLK